jgi:hypothetical protein
MPIRRLRGPVSDTSIDAPIGRASPPHTVGSVPACSLSKGIGPWELAAIKSS